MTMSDSLSYLDRLAQRARQEQAPQGDVATKVIGRLPPRRGSFIKPLLVFGAVYAAAASVAVVFGLTLFSAMNDPLVSLFQEAVLMMP
jgi:hypothetical protein